MTRIPGGVQTYSKHPSRFGEGAPTKIVRAYNGYVYSGQPLIEWVDYVAGLGPVILGHCDTDVDLAVVQQMGRGICYPMASPLEEELAELLAELVPNAEMTRFAKNGVDVTSAAVRLARAVTGRDRIVSIGYHGWADWTLEPPAIGVPALVQGLTTHVRYDDLDGLKAAFRWQPPACLILEPITTADPRPRPPVGYLELCRELCDHAHALLIYDEVVIGFRAALGGSQEAWNAPTPDLICLGKAMGNGYPISALVGLAKYMTRLQSGDVFFSTTFGGDCLGLAASLATLTKLRDRKVLDTLAERGHRLMTSYTLNAEKAGLSGETAMVGYPQRPVVTWRNESDKRIFVNAMTEAGYLFQGFHNLMLAHSEEIITGTIAAEARALEAVSIAQRKAA